MRKKRLLAGMLSLVMMCGMTVFAAPPTRAETRTNPYENCFFQQRRKSSIKAASTTLASVSATVTAPAAGETPSNTALADGVGFTAEVAGWVKSDANGAKVSPMHSTDTFEAGKYYLLGMRFTPNAGYTFADDLTASVNGKIGNWYENQHQIYEVLFYIDGGGTPAPVEITTLTSVSVTVKTPVGGDHPGNVIIAGGRGYTPNIVTWYDGGTPPHPGAEISDETFAFTGGNNYPIDVSFTLKDGYTLDNNAVVTINGQTAERFGNVYCVSLTALPAPASTTLTSVSAFIQTPAAGETPSSTFLADGVGFTASCAGWFKSDASGARVSPLFSTDTFQAGQYYLLGVAFLPTAGYSFADDLTASVNGKTGKWCDNQHQIYDMLFYVDENDTPVPVHFTTLSSVSATITAPAAGNIPSEFAMADGVGFTAEVAGWFESDASGVHGEHPAVFEAGKYYLLGVRFAPKPGYIFTDDITASVNGKTGKWYENQHEFYEVLFYIDEGGTPVPVETTTLTSVSVTVKTPVGGDHPGDVIIADEKGYTPKIVTWHDGGTPQNPGAEISDETFAFTGGNNYPIDVSFTLKDGYILDDHAVVKINGQTAEKVGNVYCVSLTALPAPTTTTLSSVSAFIHPPAAGEAPSNTVLADGVGFIASVAGWFESDASGVHGKKPAAFAAGKYYLLGMRFAPKPGYTFADDLTASVNGKIGKWYENQHEIYEVLFYVDKGGAPAPVKITTLSSVSAFVSTPAAGYMPSPTVIADGVGFTAEVAGWFESNASGEKVVPMLPTVFEAGKYYLLGVRFAPDAGYTFADNITASVNGKTGNWYNNQHQIYEVLFQVPEAPAKTTLSSVSAFVSRPAAGNIPSNIVIGDGAGFTAEVAGWVKSDASGAKVGPMLPTDTFEAGKYYLLGMRFAPDAGYTFADDITASVNGKTGNWYNNQHEIYEVLFHVPLPGKKVSGDILSFDNKGGLIARLYDSETTMSAIRADIQSTTPSMGIAVHMIGDPVGFGKQFARSFDFSDIPTGNYQLALFQIGKPVNIKKVAIVNEDVSLGKINMTSYGNVTQSGTVSAPDAVQIGRFLTGKSSVFDTVQGEEQDYLKNVANVTEISSGSTSDKLDAADIMQIKRYLAGKKSVLSLG